LPAPPYAHRRGLTSPDAADTLADGSVSAGHDPHGMVSEHFGAIKPGNGSCGTTVPMGPWSCAQGSRELRRDDAEVSSLSPPAGRFSAYGEDPRFFSEETDPINAGSPSKKCLRRALLHREVQLVSCWDEGRSFGGSGKPLLSDLKLEQRI